MFGFGMNKYGRWDHYYDGHKVGQDVGVRATYHATALEDIVRNKLAAENIIKLYPGRTS